jgi:hypothetical protein
MGKEGRIYTFTEWKNEYRIGPTFIPGGLSYDEYTTSIRDTGEFEE